MNSTLQGNYEMGEYSTVSNYRLSHGVTGEEVSTADQPLPQLFYAQAVNNPIKKNEDKDTADLQEEWPPSAIYAQVDKKKSKEKSPPQTPEPYTSLDQMYAQVDKKKREVSEDPPCESGDVYSVVNRPSAPEIRTSLGRHKHNINYVWLKITVIIQSIEREVTRGTENHKMSAVLKCYYTMIKKVTVITACIQNMLRKYTSIIYEEEGEALTIFQ